MLAYQIHVTTAALTIVGFFIRGVLLFTGSDLLQRKWLKILPHVVDTALFASAITLVKMTGLNPSEHPWMAAKVVGLLIYIALGLLAFRFGSTRERRIAAWLGAMAVFAYIVAVAFSKKVLIFV